MQVAAFATGNMEWLRHGTEDLGGTAAFADWGGFPKGVVIGMTTCESASSQVVMGMTGSWITPTEPNSVQKSHKQRSSMKLTTQL